ncbi:MAG: hypothetical protein NZ902_05880 [Acidilobaceae archaeon]|nr:hypothetical protein [Acidilobaceae archaeon]MCX8166094.1 hypothetical protein [Acidilobaceae archaeon]MDW7974737.1 hypothetical protein [Sulfolobales archaeon]
MKRGSLTDILSRRDPHGYYVIPVKAEGRELVEKILTQHGEPAKLVETKDIVLVRVKARNLAEKIVRAAERRNLIAVDEEEEV